ncbi:MAG: UTP--glucose-1-phosphate uridylyltransferase [Clostridiales bacterium]|nr:UTP--glucose-1-phosphate uridylyltransferase [Clostridiales bacterium]
MKVTKAIITAAGLGTRVLPASKAVPKEMLNIVDKPAVQYLVEEAASSGITDILIITNRNKEAIENHFDYAYELEDNLRKKPGGESLYNSVRRCAELANIYFLRQKETRGVGHAVLTAKTFVGGDPCAILFGDDIIINDEYPVTKQLADAFDKYGRSVTAVRKFPKEQIMKYCTLDVEPLEGNVMNCRKIIEKPDEEHILSLYASIGRNVVTPDIFEVLERTEPSPKTGEIYLSDALNEIACAGKLCALEFVGKRYDMGDKFGILQANCEVALNHPEIGAKFKDYIKELAKTF